MKKLPTALLRPLLLTLSFSASADEREWIPYQKLVESIKPDRCHALPAAQRDKVLLYAPCRPANKNISLADVKLTVFDAGARYPLALDQRGRAQGGEKRDASDARNQIRVKGDSALLAENRRVTLTDKPFEAEIDTDQA